MECFCAQGLELAADSTSCQNVDECRLSPSPCQQRCQDLSPGFQCSCLPGYSLQPDLLTCEPCGDNQFGENCAQTCECGGRGGGCNPVSGCLCQEGWAGQDCDEDVNECQENPAICGSVQECLNTQGSFLCRCPQGYTENGTQCTDVDECSDVALNTCSQSQTCQNTEGTFLCNCQAGFQGENCTDIDECATGLSGCQHFCLNLRGSFNCRCSWGYDLGDDRKSCVKVEDVCAQYGGKNCTQGCTVDQGSNTPRCFCDQGYQLHADNLTCQDINECAASGTNECSHNCTNTQGNYECSCPPGFSLDNDQRTCRECQAGLWGQDCNQTCGCGRGASHCDKVTGCVCEEGWTGTECKQDEDECSSSSPCTAPATCQNLPGSFRCLCPEGFSLNQTSNSCQDVDECKSSPCAHFCNNTVGSFQCSCFAGFSQNGTECPDQDECLTNSSGCQHQCSNTAGSFLCGCNQGYDLNPDGRTCREVDECVEGRDNCTDTQNCSNTVGGFSCSCLPGFQTSGSTCIDEDECSSGSHNCSASQTCLNSPGSFSCSCPVNTQLFDTQCISAKKYPLLVSLNKEFEGDIPENREKFRASLKNHFEINSEANAVLDVKVTKLRNGSTEVEVEVVMNAEDQGRADAYVVKAVLVLRDSGLTVGNESVVVLWLHLEGQAVASGASPCDVMRKHYCQGPTKTCVETNTYTAECRDVTSNDALVLGLSIGLSLGALALVTGVLLLVFCKKSARIGPKGDYESHGASTKA